MSAWEREWKMNLATHGLDKGEFALEKHQADGFVYYTMNLIACERDMADSWSDCKLVKRGRFLQPWGAEPLKPFAASTTATYMTGIQNWLKKVTSATLRLEGDLEITLEGPAVAAPVPEKIVSTQAVTMYIAANAVKLPDNSLRDMLILRVLGRVGSMDMVGAPDGTGTGDPTRN